MMNISGNRKIRRTILVSVLAVFSIASLAMAQTQSHPLSQISADNNLNMNTYNLTNAGWLVYNTGIVSGGVRGIPGADIQPSAVTPSLISAGAVGSTKLANPLVGPVNVSGALNASSFYDYDNSGYFLDLASTGTSMIVAGSISAVGWVNATSLNVSSSGYFGGNVGIGAASPGAKLQIGDGSSNNDAIKLLGTGGKWLNLTSGVIINAVGDPLKIQTESVERMRIDSSGNVGIGTASPASELDIRSATGAVEVSMTSIGANSYALLSIGGSNGARVGYFGVEGSGAGRTDVGGTLDNATYFGSRSNDATQIISANTARMTILSSGSVGIGTANPGYRGDVSGSFRVQGTAQAGASSGAGLEIHPGSTIQIYGYNRTANSPMPISFQEAGSEKVIFYGSVGIGTAGPSTKLEIQETSGARVRLAKFGSQAYTGQIWGGSNADSSIPQFITYHDGADDTTGNYYGMGQGWAETDIRAGSTGYIQFFTNNVAPNFVSGSSRSTNAQMTIDSSGKVGIGTATPQSLLQVGTPHAVGNQYIQIDAENGVTPTAGDCDANSESGRMLFNQDDFQFWVCAGVSGWKSVTLA